MSVKAIFREKQKSIRIILMASQILLPFVLYTALEWGNRPLAIATAVLLGLSMAVLVWLG